ncbi:hypothetical protein GCM10027614_80420 [Micromonospora vulcania]
MANPERRRSLDDLDHELAAKSGRENYLRDLVRSLLVADDELKVPEEDQPAILQEMLARQESVWEQVRAEELAATAALVRARGTREPRPFLVAAGAVVLAFVGLVLADVVNWPYGSLQPGDFWPIIGIGAAVLVVALLNVWGDNRNKRQRLFALAVSATGDHIARVQAEVEMLLRFVLNERAGTPQPTVRCSPPNERRRWWNWTPTGTSYRRRRTRFSHGSSASTGRRPSDWQGRGAPARRRPC